MGVDSAGLDSADANSSGITSAGGDPVRTGSAGVENRNIVKTTEIICLQRLILYCCSIPGPADILFG